MNTTRTAAPVTITLAPINGKIQVTITRDGQVIATRTTKDGSGLIQRVDSFLRNASVRREGFKPQGTDAMVAQGVVLL